MILENAFRVINFKSLPSLTIKIENFNSKIINFDYQFKSNSDSLKGFYKNISLSALNKESCMLEIKRGLISVNDNDKIKIIIIFKLISKDEFQFQIENLIDEFEEFYKIKNAIVQIFKSNEEENNYLYNKKQNNENKIQVEEAYQENRNDTFYNKDFKCINCAASLSELIKQRGDDVYFVPAINLKERNAFICDLCLQGF